MKLSAVWFINSYSRPTGLLLVFLTLGDILLIAWSTLSLLCGHVHDEEEVYICI